MRRLSDPSFWDSDLIDVGWSSGIGIFKHCPVRISYVICRAHFQIKIQDSFQFESVKMTTVEHYSKWGSLFFGHNLIHGYIHEACPAAAAAESLQSCPTLCNPIDGSPPGSPVPGILQARTLEWVAIYFSNAWKWKVKVKSLSHIQLLATPWTAAYQAPPSMGFSKQEYCSGLPLPSPEACPTWC